jgi:hypothetical protein
MIEKHGPCLLVACFLIFALPLCSQDGFQIRVVQSPEDLPKGMSTLAKKGDLFLTDGKYAAVLGAGVRPITTSANYPFGQAMGSLLSFVPAGKNIASDLNIGSPVIRIKDKTHHLGYSSINQVKSGAFGPDVRFKASCQFADKEGRTAVIETVYTFAPTKGRLDIVSTLTNTGKSEIEELSYSLFSDTYSRFFFSPYHEKKFPRMNFRVYQKKGHFLGWISFNPVESGGARYPGRLAPGEKCELRYTLLVNASDEDLLQGIYQILDASPVKAAVAFKDYGGEWLEITVREAVSSAVFFRSILADPIYHEILLPPGIYVFQAHFFPAQAEEMLEVKADGENVCTLQSPSLGKVKIRIKDGRGEPVPGKVTFLGLAPTRSPYFRPENPVETGRGWEGFKNSCFPAEDGLEVELPVGTYLAYAARGPEYSLDQKVVEIVKEKNRDLVFVIDRVVETPGLIALDPHLHTTRSDGSPSIAERIRSVVAEGIEVAVATDHNTVSDYGPALKKLHLEGRLTVIPGCEVTTQELIHYNTYPMQIRPGEEGNGAIDASADAPGPLFAASRQKDPGVLLQVNHPRAGYLGYFNNLDLEQESAATSLPALDMSFDLLEVMNGPYFYSSNQSAIEDWFHLLNRGYYFPIVGSSDSHGIDRGEPGYSRTYVQYSGGDAAALDRKSLLESLKKGRSFTSNGPLLSFQVEGRAAQGDTVPARDGRVDIQIEAWSAPWVAVDELRIVMNGQRRVIFPVPPSADPVKKFKQSISLTLNEDTYICVEALGGKTLFPVLQRPSRTGALEDGTVPYALTNPVFVDVDGNGRFDPPLSEKIRPASAPGPTQKRITR